MHYICIRKDYGTYFIPDAYIEKMLGRIGAVFCLLLATTSAVPSEQTDHRDFQYNSVIDPATGRYNFAYDTGHDNDIAHSLHMQYQDADGIVRGRYGYTDPNGKLRMVEYEAGPNGFVARGDVGPDQFPHGEAPAPGPASPGDAQPVLSSYRETSGNDFDLDPAPVQMAGWDPEADPMKQVQPGGESSSTGPENTVGATGDSSGLDPSNQYTTLNVTSYNALDVYGPELGFYSGRYPRISYSTDDSTTNRETENPTDQSNESDEQSQPIRENEALNIYNIDVDPNQIREAAGGAGPVRRSADGGRTARLSTDQNRYQYVRVPYSYRNVNYARQTHDHDAEMRSRLQHDHAEERRRYYYYLARQRHDHDAEKRYRARQTHDHDAEKRYSARQTHDHDAEKYIADHDYDAKRRAYLSRTYNYPRRIFYRDSHSMEPHEHWDNPVYRNYRDHQHSDRHLYGRYRNYAYPATAYPRQLRYIPSDKYHDKAYYWTNE